MTDNFNGIGKSSNSTFTMLNSIKMTQIKMFIGFTVHLLLVVAAFIYINVIEPFLHFKKYKGMPTHNGRQLSVVETANYWMLSWINENQLT